MQMNYTDQVIAACMETVDSSIQILYCNSTLSHAEQLQFEIIPIYHSRSSI